MEIFQSKTGGKSVNPLLELKKGGKPPLFTKLNGPKAYFLAGAAAAGAAAGFLAFLAFLAFLLLSATSCAGAAWVTAAPVAGAAAGAVLPSAKATVASKVAATTKSKLFMDSPRLKISL
jgi:hypothetical protein